MFLFLPFADLVVIAREFHTIPFRTRPLKPSASMVLRLKPRESRTLPGLPRAEKKRTTRHHNSKKTPREKSRGVFLCPKFRGENQSLAACITACLAMKPETAYTRPKALDRMSYTGTWLQSFRALTSITGMA